MELEFAGANVAESCKKKLKQGMKVQFSLGREPTTRKYVVVDIAPIEGGGVEEKKTKKRRREKREEENYVDTENNSDRNTKKSAVSGSRVSNRKSPKTEIQEQKLGAMQRDNRKSAHFANPNENKEKLLDPNNNY